MLTASTYLSNVDLSTGLSQTSADKVGFFLVSDIWGSIRRKGKKQGSASGMFKRVGDADYASIRQYTAVVSGVNNDT